MANDRATMDAINSISSMFPDIDQETITDIFLGCKKDVDKAVDQLLGMGAMMESKTPQVPTQVPVDTPLLKPVSPPEKVPTSPPISHIIDSNSERERLELLNHQLSQEYRRLAETQERNLTLEKQLAATQATINAEYQSLKEERLRLEEQQAAFRDDKKRLEEHLSGRLREMKEEMRRKEEEARESEEARRRELERYSKAVDEERQALFQEEKKKVEDEWRARELQEESKAEQEREVFEHLLSKERMEQVAANHRAESLHKDIESLRTQNVVLCGRVIELEQSFAGSVQKSSQEIATIADTLQTVSLWLKKGAEECQQNGVSPTDIKQELLKALLQE